MNDALSPSAEDRLQQRVTIARRLFGEYMSGHRFELADELFAPDSIVHFPGSPPLDNSPEHALARFKAQLEATPDYRIDVQDVVADGSLTAVRWILRATHELEYLGAAPTGQLLEVEGMMFLRMRDERIIEIWHSIDYLGLLHQLGLLPDAITDLMAPE